MIPNRTAGIRGSIPMYKGYVGISLAVWDKPVVLLRLSPEAYTHRTSSLATPLYRYTGCFGAVLS